MRCLFQRFVFLWPRFHVNIDQTFETATKTRLIEIRVPLTKSIKDIQAGLMDCIQNTISDARRILRDVDDGFSIEDVISYIPFMPSTMRAKNIYADLKTLRQLLFYLTSYDAVTFYMFLETIRNSVSASSLMRGDAMHWLLLDSANAVFESAKNRVFRKRADGTNASCEELPKWKALIEILKEIEVERRKNPGKILIMCANSRSRAQLRKILSGLKFTDLNQGDAAKSISELHQSLVSQYLFWKRNMPKDNLVPLSKSSSISAAQSIVRNANVPNKRRRVRGGKAPAAESTRDSEAPEERADAQVEPTDTIPIDPQYLEEAVATEINFDYFSIIPEDDCIVIRSYSEDYDCVLEEQKPDWVILFDLDVKFIRCVEVVILPIIESETSRYIKRVYPNPCKCISCSTTTQLKNRDIFQVSAKRRKLSRNSSTRKVC